MAKPKSAHPKSFRDRSNPVVAQQLGHAQRLYAQGQLDQAELFWHRALLAEPGNPLALHGLGRVALKRRRPKEAMRLLRQAADSGWHTFELVYDYAVVLLTLELYEDAGTMFQEALKLDANSAACYVNMGIIRTFQQRHDDAAPFFAHALRMAPNDPDVLSNMAAFLGSVGQPEAARAMYETVLSAAPDHPAAQAGRAKALEDLNQPSDI